MRAGGCTVQQALTPEAASIVKQAVSLARRRGHAQVTPLHVASAMLSSSTGLLRAACLQSHSHPLQCKALELCFNVALNRLPACSSSSSSPMLATHYAHHHSPSLSNALVAAFKRAQAHQRRGSVETQQQPLLAVKIELEQLIISILDDPSVSRVMREAGFSSTQVKTNVEQAVSSETCSPNPNPSPSADKPCKVGSSSSTVLVSAQQSKPRSEDVMSLVKTLISGRRSVVVVGECLINSEGVVKELMDRVNKGDVQEVLRGVQFINLPLSSFKHMLREEVERKVGELGCLVRSYSVGRGAILYLGDLKWAAEYWVGCGENGKNLYCPIESVMREIGKLVGSGIGAFWVMGVATYHTYMKCRIGNPSLETLWSLHPLTIPIGSLDLSLNNFDSDLQSHLQCKRNGDGVSCADCPVTFDNGNYGSIKSNLPSWLQQYKEDNRGATSNQQDSIQLRDLCKKWNSICNSSHKHQQHSYEKTLNFSSLSPSSSSFSSHQGWPVTTSAKQPWREHCFLISETIDEEGFKPNSRVSSQDHHEGQRSSPQYYTNPKHNPNSASSTDTMEMDHLHKFKELNAENLKILCNALEEKVSWQMDIIPEIASTILQCRSGMMRRKERSTTARTKEETWLFFQGGDVEGKEKIAKELANLVFGSFSNFVSIGISNFSSTRADSTDDLRNKRSRDEVGHSYLERFVEVIRENPHRVVLMEDIEQVDYYSQMGLKAAMERGWIQGSNGEEITINDAIIILSCESFDSRSRACSPTTKQKTESDEEKEEESEKEISSCVCLDLNVCAENEEVGNGSSDEVGLLDSVDRTFFFKLPDDL